MNNESGKWCANCRRTHETGKLCPVPASRLAGSSGYHSESEPGRRLAPLYDFDGHGQFKVEQPELECPCAGLGWLCREWLEKRASRCTCGAGDPNDPYLRHDVSCDSVPCPFCPLEADDDDYPRA